MKHQRIYGLDAAFLFTVPTSIWATAHTNCSGIAPRVAVATNHVIESFRNDLWPACKTGEGIEPDLWAQFPLFQEVLAAAGIIVWPMIEFEADDALAAAAAAADQDARVERVII